MGAVLSVTERRQCELALLSALHRLMTPRAIAVLRIAVLASIEKEITVSKTAKVRTHSLRAAVAEASQELAEYMLDAGTSQYGKVLSSSYARRYVHQFAYMPSLVDRSDLSVLRSCYDLHSGYLSSYGIVAKLKFTRVAMVVLQRWDTDELVRASESYGSKLMVDIGSRTNEKGGP